MLHGYCGARGFMANLTITVEDAVLQRARIKALEQGTSVNALLRLYLESFADSRAERDALEHFIELAQRSEAGSSRTKRSWTRDELHER